MSGLTLLELVVVLAILVAITALMPVAFDRALPSRRLASAGESLLRAIQSAQTRSMSNGEVLDLTISLVGAAAAIQESQTETLPTEQVVLDFDGTLHMTDDTGGATNRIRFYPDGSLSGTRIVLSAGPFRHAIHLSGLTGTISYERAHHDEPA
jgi:general secretion pathway protein H